MSSKTTIRANKPLLLALIEDSVIRNKKDVEQLIELINDASNNNLKIWDDPDIAKAVRTKTAPIVDNRSRSMMGNILTSHGKSKKKKTRNSKKRRKTKKRRSKRHSKRRTRKSK